MEYFNAKLCYLFVPLCLNSLYNEKTDCFFIPPHCLLYSKHFKGALLLETIQHFVQSRRYTENLCRTPIILLILTQSVTQLAPISCYFESQIAGTTSFYPTGLINALVPRHAIIITTLTNYVTSSVMVPKLIDDIWSRAASKNFTQRFHTFSVRWELETYVGTRTIRLFVQ